jgi:site-specific DNA-methyltransferase (cytosine-N4-specific)
LDGCRLIGEKQHPARFPAKLPEFFINMLTEPGDLVLDIFAGSNTTGHVAQTQGRRWLAFESSREYIGASAFRFLDKRNTHSEMREIFDRIERGEIVDLNHYAVQRELDALGVHG